MAHRGFNFASLAVCAALVLGGCGGSSKGRNDIVFVSTRDGAYELYAMNADGSHQHRLTHDKGSTASARGVYYQLQPAWSPDGRLIAFASLRDGPATSSVVGADGKKTRELTSGSQSDTHPTWSPDGKRIAFVRGRTGDLEVMNVDGTSLHQVARGGRGGAAGEPEWSPDGGWIAVDVRASGASTTELWLVHANGSDPHAVTSIGALSISAAWSPNGTRIAFSSNKGGSTLGLYTIGVSGRGLHLLTSFPAVDAITPAWSPDGKTIAFSADGAITLISASGTDERRITNPKNNDSSPVWNPRPAKR